MKNGCFPQLLIIFQEKVHSEVSYDGKTSMSFIIQSGVKQGCVLVPATFDVYFPVLMSFAFIQSVVYLYTRSNAKLFNLTRLRARTKVCTVLIREMLLADDAAVTPHPRHDL